MGTTILQVSKDDLRYELQGIFSEMLEKAEKQAKEKANNALITPDETSARLAVSKVTLWRWSKSGYLTPINVGGKVRYKTSDVEAILSKGGSQ